MSVFDNKRYRTLKLDSGVYVPDCGIDYPEEDPYARLVEDTLIHDTKFDETYDFLDDSLKFRLSRTFIYLTLVYGILYLINIFRFGVRFRGRKILKQYKKELSSGVMVVSNHCYKYDASAIAVLLNKRLWIPMLADHLNGNDARKLRYFGGIPVPDTMGGMKKFNAAFDEINRRKGWILVFPEGRSWWFYKPLKPFQKGAFTMAYKYQCPILPVNISYRERNGIYRLFGSKEIPLITLTIGKPIFPDMTKTRREGTDILLKESFKAVCDLGGISENSWPMTWNEGEGGNI